MSDVKDSVPAGWHVGRAWSGTEIEDACPCPKAPCGLIDVAATSADCQEHPIGRGKSIRQGHAPSDCPVHGTPLPEEPHHRVARQLTDGERSAVDAMKAGLPRLAEKARALLGRHGGSHAV